LVVFYSRNYNLLDRLQAEDRNHRIGQKNNVTYIDLITADTVETIILKNLERKRLFASDLLQDDEEKSYIKNIIEDIRDDN